MSVTDFMAKDPAGGLIFFTVWANTELRKVTKNYRVSVDNFQWIDSGLSQISERATVRLVTGDPWAVGTFNVRRGALTPEPWADD